VSDWMEEVITQIETQNSLDYLDLFEFNGYNPPKFWFGDRVKFFSHSHMTGTVLGLEWRDGEKVLARDGSENGGWWYRICLDGRQSLMGFHEDSLEQIGE